MVRVGGGEGGGRGGEGSALRAVGSLDMCVYVLWLILRLFLT